ncbi:unnamed protein product [Symbiodinium natans]|uniref:Peptidase C1A papain C-terminal domain-containing protein n=1 Tax=Symbiodinium natans TaxID=878477 RepID=A0A812QWR0_9DINO|nr:unnamed protein product [Symbiodinium natans]
MADVLKQICDGGKPHYCRYAELTQHSAVSAALKGNPLPRVVIITVRMRDHQWILLSSGKPVSVQGLKLLDDTLDKFTNKEEGHAMAIVAESKTCWVVKNSWGSDISHGGYVYIQKSQELDKLLKVKYFDVHWFIKDLPAGEREAFKKAGQQERERYETSVRDHHEKQLSHLDLDI